MYNKKDKEAIEAIIWAKYRAIKNSLNEKSRRRWAAAEARSYGHGGIALVMRATNISRTAINNGLTELANLSQEEGWQGVRKPGGGRKKITETQKDVLQVLRELVEPTEKGDPESPLKWTNKSTRNLQAAFNQRGIQLSHNTVYKLLRQEGYRMQANRKSLEDKVHPDRDAQFNYINASIQAVQHRGQPTISVDAKKKENIGNYKNNGREYRPKQDPLKVNGHDFTNPSLGKVAPYGVYDIGKNKGWVSVGVSADTAEFSVNAIRAWWYAMGSKMYVDAKELLITADCGGSNGNRVRLWKTSLQELSDELGLEIHVRHLPPGTSKWNKIEHRLFSYISMNWRGRPLLTRETVVNLISSTTTRKGLQVKAMLDENIYERGKKISNKELASINIKRADFHPEWNYTIFPRKAA